jgi:hypothetical protein
MKHIFIYPIILFLASPSKAQYFLTPASGNSGIIIKNEEKFDNGLNYSTADSRFGFSASKWRADTKTLANNSNGGPRIQNSSQFGFNAGLSTKESSSDVFKGGGFSPSFDVALDFVRFLEKHEKNGDDKGGFNSLFMRAKFSIAPKDFAKEDNIKKGNYVLETKSNVFTGIGVGWNTLAEDEEKFLFGFSSIFSRTWNSADTLKKQHVSTQVTGINQKKDTIYLNDSKERYIGAWSELTKIQMRGDGILKLGNVGGLRDNAIIGLMGSVTIDLGYKKNPRYNFAVGPSLNSSKKINQTIAALMFEITDATNSLGKTPEFNDKFTVKAYVGIPFSLLK